MTLEHKRFSHAYHMLDTLLELWAFLRVRKKFWLVPIIAILMFLGAIMVVASSPAATPFIYALF